MHLTQHSESPNVETLNFLSIFWASCRICSFDLGSCVSYSPHSSSKIPNKSDFREGRYPLAQKPEGGFIMAGTAAEAGLSWMVI